jgi:hypothetical protein
MTIACIEDGLMYKPGATFYDPIMQKTLVCCSGIIHRIT